MAAPVANLQPVKLAAGPVSLTPEQKYWRSFKSQTLVPAPANHSITHISFPPAPLNPASTSSSDYFAATTGTRVQIFSIRTRRLVKIINRFDDVAHSGDIRYDGRVLVAGDDTGKIQVFDINSRAILRTWHEHKQPVWVTKFSPRESTVVMSASDDRTVRLWDLPTQESTATFTGHQDYVRTGSFMPGQASGLLVSGSYDQTVKLWDQRVPGQAVMTFKHSAAVEDVLPLPSGTTILAAADNEISVLDIVAGRPIEIIRNHQKTVTSLALASKGRVVVSGGLDGHVKMFDTTSWQVTAGVKYQSPILAVSVICSGTDREDRHLAVGMQSGLLSIRTRLSGQQKVKERAKEKEMKALIEGRIEEHDRKKEKKRPKGIEKRLRGIKFPGDEGDILIQNEKRERKTHAPWEGDLRKGKYASALDKALERSTQGASLDVLTLLTALKHRSALATALKGRDEITLQPILRWIHKHLVDPRYVSISVDAVTLILDLYSEQMGQSANVDKLVKNLHRRVTEEVLRSQLAWQMQGMLDMLTTEME
ncbi:MAG: hypothetical protein M1834_007933 [Cirrosporium novae-zelandiae]|nr:MAG: hypothetical protein M1834_007933 [Cirrosporium novae-zelandiae]